MMTAGDTFSFKAFTVGKDGEENGRQDRMACNAARGLYCVSDGVSRSYHPEFLAQALCDIFVEGGLEDYPDWPSYCAQRLLPEAARRWQEAVTQYQATLSGRRLRHDKIVQDMFHVGAATFCGVAVDEAAGVARYFVLGDSTLAFADTEGRTTSVVSTPASEEAGNEPHIDYSSLTYALLSDGQAVGHWRVGEMPLAPGHFVLMTDGVAAWFQKQREAGLRPAGWLWSLADRGQFLRLVELAHAEGDMDDDLTLLILSTTERTPLPRPEPEPFVSRILTAYNAMRGHIVIIDTIDYPNEQD